MSETKPVAYRWTYDLGQAWSLGPNAPTDFRFGEPDEIQPLYPASAITSLMEENERLKEENGQLIDENSDLRYEPWPEWAKAVLSVIRKHSGYDGYDDATEGVDMPLELSETLAEMEAEADRWKIKAEAAEARAQAAEQRLREIAESDDIDNALDPERNKRVAAAYFIKEAGA